MNVEQKRWAGKWKIISQYIADIDINVSCRPLEYPLFGLVVQWLGRRTCDQQVANYSTPGRPSDGRYGYANHWWKEVNERIFV